MTDAAVNPAAIEHLPVFISQPGQTDYLFVAVIIFLVVAVLAVGNLYFQLHAVPERMAHRTSKVQMEVVAVLALISLFTHNHLFWIAGLLLAFVQIPDFSSPLYSIAQSLGKLSGRDAATTGDPALMTEPFEAADTAKPAMAPAKTTVHGEGI
ncbi:MULTISPECIES: hypothetical protein [Rhizobium]|uniref:hypothetical protein n=1 Tax=Rhizobium TaxID=379 RepID=UPI00234E7E7B|nr:MULTISPECIES: hypothetical protein [unclassified Rhizobium]MDC7741203.1 hypothetical protein [Rhizobium sp. BC56]MDC9810814.1 hypothetical protein [Rhizobium sp. MC62]MDC9834373.1 hypothetical protein [Rhizobium sp. MJ37]WEA59024.1 hypothetical protein PO860_15185 [Rhizobium sp. BJ04]